MKTKSHAHTIKHAVTMGVLVILTSCSSFTAHYSARSHEHLTSLKAHHLKLIDDNTRSETGFQTTFSRSKLEEAIDAGDLKFREAQEYSKSLSDTPRTRNIDLLHDIFRYDTSNVASKGRLLNLQEAKTLKTPTSEAYDKAIKGEQLRVNSQHR